MSWQAKTRNAVLALEDGSIFRGFAFGAKTTVTGEAVFNTGMTGYQETLTDPSYFGQIVTMTTPQDWKLWDQSGRRRIRRPQGCRLCCP